jgi:2-oxoisovalerate dehydrogenase E1 component
MNFAALKQLPVLFVCENNLYAIHSHIRDRLSNLDFCARARAYGMPAERIEGNDIFALRDATTTGVKELRAGGGPRFIEIETYRLARHVGPGADLNLQYRSEAEVESWRERDQITRLARLLPEADRKRVNADVEREITEAFAFAESSPFPGGGELLTYVFHD